MLTLSKLLRFYPLGKTDLSECSMYIAVKYKYSGTRKAFVQDRLINVLMEKAEWRHGRVDCVERGINARAHVDPA